MKVRSALILSTLVALSISQSTSSGNIIGYQPVNPDRTNYNFNGQTDYQNNHKYPKN